MVLDVSNTELYLAQIVDQKYIVDSVPFYY